MKSCAFVLTCVLLAASVRAADVEELQPKVSFSAWRVMSAGSTQAQGKYYYAPSKYRNEMEINGQKMTTIYREDLDTVWNLMPGQQMYMELDLGKLVEQGGATLEGSEILEREPQGAETVNGYRTTKYKVTVRDALGGTSSGFLWATKDMIPVKVDMTAQNGQHVMIELSQIEVGPQPDSLFDVPAGYRKFSLGGLGGLAGAAEAQPGGGPSAGPGEASQPQSSDSGDGGFAQGVADAVKDGAAEGAKQGVEQGVKQGVREKVKGRIRKLFRH
jgi:outer membrane lipoprotein-sorting protein